MTFSAMELTEENLELVTRFETALIKNDSSWMHILFDEGKQRGINYYIVISYAFANMAFVREAISIYTTQMFHKKYVLVQEDPKGFTQAVLREDVE